ncbi:hypothetical protein PCP57_04840 [Pseudomonas aeruginosa]
MLNRFRCRPRGRRTLHLKTQERDAMNRIHLALGLALALPAFAALAQETVAPATEKDGVLVDGKGMTLYTYDKDSEGQSACSGPCAKNWPPLAAAQGAQANGDWSLVAREDGTQQWAYYGKPLYTFIQDKKPGDKNGDGKMGAWHVAQPDMD